jgi:murein DD-endopeptidase MepM/ murein hydrolase activator NlpD
MINIFKGITLLIFFVGCSHIKSGQHVYWDGSKPLQTIAKEHQTSLEDIKKNNPTLTAGSWIFVPNQVGWLQFFKETTSEVDYSMLGDADYIWPVPGFYKISSDFGPRAGRNHDGIDIPGKVGAPILAVASGRVQYADNKISGYGNMIIIEHSKDIFSVYAHNDENIVRVGDQVKKGQKIATLGNTGRSSGPHLHFEIRYKNKPKNPSSFIRPPTLAQRK